MSKIITPQEARKRIEELEIELRRNNWFYAADAFERYLSGEARTLDEAFGVTQRKARGRPTVQSARDLEIAWKLFRFKSSPNAKKRGAVSAYEEELTCQYGLSDARKVREIYKRKFPKVASYAINKKLRERDAGDRRDREQRGRLQMRAIRKRISKRAESGP
jgi:hypothetical protein